MNRIGLVFFALVFAAPACAWGPLGHKLVGTLAEAQLSPEVRERALAILAADPIDDGAHLADVANWADAVRGSHDARYTDTYKWHWVHFDASSCRYDAAKQCEGGHCVVGGVEINAQRLADRALAPARRAEALRFLVHFVGDIHQPLHAGYRNDRNGFEVALHRGEESWSLHGVWDYVLLDSRDLGPPEYAAVLKQRRLPSAGALKPALWAEESCRMTRDDGVYPPAAELDAAWIASRRALAEARVRLAGARLAALIDAALRD